MLEYSWKVSMITSVDIECIDYSFIADGLPVSSFSNNRAPESRFLGPLHTSPFSKENGAVLLRIRLSSTLKRRKRSPKTEPFENALQSGAIWKRCFLKMLFSSVDGENDAIWKRLRHQNRHDRAQTTRPWVFKMADRRYHVASLLIGVVVWTGEKRYENDKCGRKSFWKRSKTTPFSFENGLMWTGPKCN